MKKLLSIVCLSLFLVACGNEEESKVEQAAESVADSVNETVESADAVMQDMADQMPAFNQETALADALSVCTETVKTLPEDQQKDALEMCECTANNTDFKELYDAEAKQDYDAMNKVMSAAFDKCTQM